MNTDPTLLLLICCSNWWNQFLEFLIRWIRCLNRDHQGKWKIENNWSWKKIKQKFYERWWNMPRNLFWFRLMLVWGGFSPRMLAPPISTSSISMSGSKLTVSYTISTWSTIGCARVLPPIHALSRCLVILGLTTYQNSIHITVHVWKAWCEQFHRKINHVMKYRIIIYALSDSHQRRPNWYKCLGTT